MGRPSPRFACSSPPADAANRFKQLLVIKQFLIGFRTLDHEVAVAIHREDCQFARLLQLANVVFREETYGKSWKSANQIESLSSLHIAPQYA